MRPCCIGIGIVILAACQPSNSGPPRLIVVISVDQMRADYLDRFAGQFTGGLARLRERGVVFTDAHQDHASTETAVGHTTIGTGVYPRKHGIVGNDFYDRTEQRTVYSAEDSSAHLVGRPAGSSVDPEDGRSPSRMLRPAIGDWLKTVSPTSKVFGVAIKDRAGTLMGGREADGSYWYDEASGRMITSTFYRDALPAWVEAFNTAGHFAAFRDSSWHRLLPADQYAASDPDEFAAEGHGAGTTFPHLLPADAEFFERIITTGYSDPLVLRFGQALVEHEGLGTDEAPDLLFLGASAGDYVGHAFGPGSHEIHDYYLRLDRGLGAFFDFLDDRMGREAWAAVLTADHGVLPLPEHLQAQGIEAGRITTRVLSPGLRSAIELARIDLPYEIEVSFSGGIVLSADTTAVTPSQMSAFREALAIRLRDLEFIEDAFTIENLASDSFDAPFIDQYRKQYLPERGPDIRVRWPENYLVGVGRTGTSHGSPYRYDTHVPMVFLRPGLAPQRVDRLVRTIDIAPTISAWLGVESPDDLDGRVLSEAMN